VKIFQKVLWGYFFLMLFAVFDFSVNYTSPKVFVRSTVKQQQVFYSLQCTYLLQIVTENSRVIIVDLRERSSSLHSDPVHPSESTVSCPRTGHYSKLAERHPNGLRTVKSVCKYTNVSN